MNNEQANTNESTVDVEEEKHSTEVNQEAVSETETPEVVQAASATETEVEEQEEGTSGEVDVPVAGAEAEESVSVTDASVPEEAVEVDVAGAEAGEVDLLTDTPAADEAVGVSSVSAEAEEAVPLTDAPAADEAVGVSSVSAEAEEAVPLTDAPAADEAVGVSSVSAESEEAVPLTDTPAADEAVGVSSVSADSEEAVPLTDTPAADEAVGVSSVSADSEEAVPLTDTPAADEAPESDAPEESVEPMSPESLEEAYDNSIKAFTDGEIVKGNVVEVSRDEVMIDIGFKSEGYIPAAEFDTGQDGAPSVQIGDEIDVYIVRREDAEGQIVLSKKIADQTLVWDEIATAYESASPVKGRITERIKGGLRVSVGSLRGFLPASQVELRPIQHLEQYVGKTFDMKVISLSKRRSNIVLSRRAWLEAELVQKRAEVLSTLEVGQRVTGVVKNITAFGAFVDLGGIDGLLHKTDMAWKRIHHPSEIVSVGEEVEVQVTGISQENEKISLGLKQKTPDPWANIEEKYPVDSTVRGTVVNIVNYGAFLQLEEGVEGLIHVSEMAWTRRNVAPSRIVNKGDEIEAVVLEISRADKRISLGIKQLKQNPWELLAEKYPVGTKITGRIRNLTSFGAFVEIEAGIDGLIHTSDLSWTKRGAAPNEFLKEGSAIEVVVLQIDAAERRVSLGLKQTQPDPWQEVPEKYKVGTVVRGTIVNLTSFGAFTKLEEGIEGLIHISELANRRIEKPEEIVSVGQELDLKVINLSSKDRRIGLSLKALIAEQERAAAPQEEEPVRERAQRPTRPRREPRRQKPPQEEAVTTLGALLKEEMGKSNAENAELKKETDESSAENTES